MINAMKNTFPHFKKQALAALLAALMVLQPALAQYNSTQLPDLGDYAQAGFSPAQERIIGEKIIHEIKQDPSFLDDPEIEDYLNGLGKKLVSATGLRGQGFYFFALKDNSINAFAMPGGYIGVHTGLINTSQNESELASVLAHEIGHVEQRHIARSIDLQKNATATVLASIALAILASRVSSQGAEAAITSGVAAATQSQLGYSRDFEREADRVGFQTLQAAGFDVHGMPSFFERMEKANGINDPRSLPGYLRTHPLTSERIADMQTRADQAKYKQVVDSLEYTLVRAKLDAMRDAPRDAVARVKARSENSVAEKAFKYYDLARVYLRANNPSQAAQALANLKSLKLSSAMIELLSADVAIAQGKAEQAVSICHNAQSDYLASTALRYCEIDAQIAAKNPTKALALLRERIATNNQDERLYLLQARTYESMGKETEQHRALSEFYMLRGNLPAAIDQLQLAQRSGGGDFYEQSAIDARLRELRAQALEAKKDR